MYLLLAFLCPLHGVDEALSKAGDKNFLYRLGWQYPQLNMGRIVELLRLKCQCNEIRVVANERLLNWGKEIGLRTGNDEASCDMAPQLSLIHISEPTRLGMISYAVFCLKKKK